MIIIFKANMTMKSIYIFNLIFLFYIFSDSLSAENVEDYDSFTIKLIDTAGCNLAIVEQQDSNTYLLSNTSHIHNWYSGVFQNIDTNSKTTFIIDMKNTGNSNSPGDVSKWHGLWPVYTYGEYLAYNLSVFYTKNEYGYWISSDLFSCGGCTQCKPLNNTDIELVNKNNALINSLLAEKNSPNNSFINNASHKFAGNGKTPIQTVIADELANEFLNSDGTYWSAWTEIQDTYPNVYDNTFNIRYKFNSKNAALAMRHPYTYDYEAEFIKRVENDNIPGVIVHDLGKSLKRQNLYIIEVCDPTATQEELRNRRVVLMYANEDGNEPDSCWVVDGAAKYLIKGLKLNKHQNTGNKLTAEEILLAQEVTMILDEITFLFIPLFDPTGWSESTYGKITSDFLIQDLDNVRPEIIAYTKFINQWAGERENRLDVVISLHNVECQETPNLLCPIINIEKSSAVLALNSFVQSNLPDSIVGSKTVWIKGFTHDRFMGWCSEHWGSLDIGYEINSRYPENRLNLHGLYILGGNFCPYIQQIL